MLCLLSPTKTLAEETCAAVVAGHARSPLLSSATHILIQRCKKLSKADLKSCMSISDNLAALNHGRFQRFEEQTSYAAAPLFDGPSFRGLNMEEFSDEEQARLDKSLCILSGLYGLLRPFDTMQPYRLEMGTRLDVDGGKNLYQFWAKHGLTSSLAALAKANGANTVVNCASQEYAKVVNFKELREQHGLNVVDITFKSKSGRMAAVFAKQARGMMVRFVVKSGAETPEQLHSFTGADGRFKFNAAQSSDTNFIFERHENPQGPGDEAAFGTSAVTGASRGAKSVPKARKPAKTETTKSTKATTASAEELQGGADTADAAVEGGDDSAAEPQPDHKEQKLPPAKRQAATKLRKEEDERGLRRSKRVRSTAEGR